MQCCPTLRRYQRARHRHRRREPQMRCGRPRDPYRAAVLALQADIAGWRKQIGIAEDLVQRLEMRADAEGGTGGTRRAVHAVHEKPAPKRRRRRRNSSRGTVPRHSSPARPRERLKPAIVEPVAAAPAKAIRGAALFGPQLEELEKVRVGLAASGDDVTIADRLRARGDAILRELNRRAKLPDWLDKAERMRWRRCTERPDTTPKPKKPKAPRKLTPPPIPPVKVDSGWREENGVLSRFIETR